MMDYNQLLNPTVTEMKPSGIRKFFDIAASMEGVISLGVGEPDFQTPWQVRKAGINALERGKTKYTSNRGLAELTREIGKYLEKRYGIAYEPNQIMVTVGGSEAIDACVRALVRPGDEVIIPQPSYVCYEPITRLAGGVPVILNTKAENDFKVTPEELEAAVSPKTKLLILPYPCNPTGAIMEKEDLERLVPILEKTSVALLSDEIYSELTFNGKRHCSPAAIPALYDRTVVVNGFSKAFSMTGWRMGYACGPKEIVAQMLKIHQFAIMCAPTVSQYAAVEALRSCEEDVEVMVEEYNMRRRFMVAGFNKLGLSCRELKGAFYAFPCIRSTGLTSDEFCEKLLQSKKVAIVPGTAFGASGEGFVRASYCYSPEHIKEALRRIGEFLQELS